MRKRVKVVLKGKSDDEGSDLEGVDQVDWVESSNAKELLGKCWKFYQNAILSRKFKHFEGQTKFISDKKGEVLNF